MKTLFLLCIAMITSCAQASQMNFASLPPEIRMMIFSAIRLRPALEGFMQNNSLATDYKAASHVCTSWYAAINDVPFTNSLIQEIVDDLPSVFLPASTADKINACMRIGTRAAGQLFHTFLENPSITFDHLQECAHYIQHYFDAAARTHMHGKLCVSLGQRYDALVDKAIQDNSCYKSILVDCALEHYRENKMFRLQKHLITAIATLDNPGLSAWLENAEIIQRFLAAHVPLDFNARSFLQDKGIVATPTVIAAVPEESFV